MFQQALVPLEGKVILDLSRYLPGPWLTRILCDLGATVIKVEPPSGDTLRHLPPLVNGVGAAFAALNAGKRSIVLDLKTPQDLEALLKLAEGADVLVESFRPGKLAKLGASLEALQARNAKLVVCSLSGYGKDSQRAGHDLDYVARAGVLGLFGPADRPPVVPGVQVADMSGALHAAIGILGALMEVEQTGQGRHLDVSLTRSAMPFAIMALAGQIGGRGQGMLTGGAPGNRVYACADGEHIALASLEPHFFATFCQRAGQPELAGRPPWDASLGPDLEALFATRPRQEWVELMAGLDVCLEPVATVDEALADPELGAAIAEAGGFRVLQSHHGAPPAPVESGPPSLDEHGAAIREELA
ncbi:MAG: CoA transferase [Proteobacteria bacterium]|nr:CoA transferase [Pseudomonadota bacterium]MCP4922123.1 CoA transferase [Pseudomonadota bacterium]